MERTFNTAGPTEPDDHYCIDPLTRLDFAEIRALIDGKRYFVLHAPRQTGKTTTLRAMMQVFNAEGHYACVYANIEPAQAARNDATRGISAACSRIARSIDIHTPGLDMNEWMLTEGNRQPAETQLSYLLDHWAQVAGKPTILFLDEVDTLVGDTLISLLRQIRAGYADRPALFPQSIILCGVRDIRDYRMHLDGQVITGGSAFNIKAESLRMGDFSEAEVRELWDQHTTETGQTFDPAIFTNLWADTQGQPWLVNALGRQVTWKDHTKRDRNVPITLSDYQAGREALILRRDTHLDQLADKLREPRVHSVISAILTGETDTMSVRPDDIDYVRDLGLIGPRPGIRIANRIYQEVIPRELAYNYQDMIPNQETAWYIQADHYLNMTKLLEAFQQFFREHADTWIPGLDYKEAGPQVLMQAFLQRIINGGGRITREYALGRKRTDLLIEWPLDPSQGMHGPLQRVVIELKIRRGALDTLIDHAISQAVDYTRRVGADDTHLVVFDRNPNTPWDQKIWHRTQNYDGATVTIWGA
jgi:hypothetical protein